MESPAKNRIWTIPNLLSFIRIALVPGIVWSYLNLEDGVLSGVLIVISGLTDIADGIIARKFNLISDLGKALDPIADKLTQAAVLICLVALFPKMLLPLILLVLKELFDGISGLMVIRKTGHVYGANWHGKVATVLLYATMLLHVFWKELPQGLSDTCVYVSSAMIVLSLVCYAVRNIGLVREGINAKKPQDKK